MVKGADFKVVGALLALSLAVGGAGVSFPRLQLLLQLAALAVAAYLIIKRRTWSFSRLSWVALTLVALVLVLPLLQLVPLPPGLWTQFPGRALPVELDAALGWRPWRPLTLDVEGTLRAFTALIPPAVLFTGCLFLPRNERAQLLWVVLAFALLSAVLGTIQFATGGWLTPYRSGHFGTSMGLFVNRNHNAALLLVAMPAAAALCNKQIALVKQQAPWALASLSAMIVLAIGVVGTTSRMGFLLLPVATAVSLIILFYGRTRSRLVSASAILLATLATLLFVTGRLERTVSRFSGLDDLRLNYWTDVQWALDYYGLAGTGFGTFVPVYKSAESLEAVTSQVTIHAHNDYLEILLEGGVPAALLFILVVVTLVIAAVRSVRTKTVPGRTATAGAALAGIGILLAASYVDYPLRMPALSTVFALCCAILLPSKTSAASIRTDLVVGSHCQVVSPVRIAVGSAVVVVLLILTIQAGLSSAALRRGQNEAALEWASWSTETHERLSTQALLRNDFQGALAHGSQAIRLSPISAPAIRSVGLANVAGGDVSKGNRVMQVAVALGWHDPLTQMWAIEAAKLSNEPEKAVQRAEALFRRDLLVVPAVVQLLSASGDSGILPALARSLAQRPTWRSRFFAASDKLPQGTSNAWLRLVTLLKRTSAPLSVDEGRPSLDALISAGQMDEAQRLWALLRDGDELLDNGDFEILDARRGVAFPSHWHVPRSNRTSVRVEIPAPNSKNRALHIRSPKDRLILRQTLMLMPGTYKLSYRAHVMDTSPSTLRWEFRCDASSSRHSADVATVPSQDWQETGALIAVLNRHCAIQRLALSWSGDISPEDVWLDEVRVRRIGR